MIMDRNYGGHRWLENGIGLNDYDLVVFPDSNVVNNNLIGSDGFINRNADFVPESCNLNYDSQDHVSEGVSADDCDFSDVVLKYISHILMEEDVEEKSCMFQESAALQAAEKSFFEALEEKNPALAGNKEVSWRVNTPDIDFCKEFKRCSCTGHSEASCIDRDSDPVKDFLDPSRVPADLLSQSTAQPAYSSSSSNDTLIDGRLDSPDSTLKIPDIFGNSVSAMQFKKGFEEASKFLPNSEDLVVDLLDDGLNKKELRDCSSYLVVKVDKCLKIEQSIIESRGKKNSYRGTSGLGEERSNKQSAICTESIVSSEMFDKVLLCSKGENESNLRKELNQVAKSNLMTDNSKGSNGGRSRGKKRGGKRNVVDMRTLLTLCAQAVAADDRRTANEFLKQIRQHASPTGDGMQRLAHYFSDGLEARMAGSGTEIYKSVLSFPTSAADVLKAYHIYLATCPFRKISNFFANKTIMNIAVKVKRLHIIDFGILYGFQWPCFMQRLSSTPGGPPKLRITGIDLPCPGFRPSERVEETGRRLERYARIFNVPFEFNAIAQKWETIKLEDLKVRSDEVLAVNSLFRFKNLLDETVIINSPRDSVLNLIRELNPAVFVLGVMNGAYNAPFFITRFREALFHFSSFFDMLDANIPREMHERVLLEKTVFGREAMNVIACEGAERIERPETYKQWQARNIRNGFTQLPFDKEIKKMSEERVKSAYHKDFVIDADGDWMLQGWKGRIVYALSSWKPSG